MTVNANDVTRLIKNELNRLNFTKTKDDNSLENVTRELRDTIRTELLNEKANVRREYKLGVYNTGRTWRQ